MKKAPSKGPKWFQDAFKKAAHNDDWGVACVYDYAAWRLVKAAMRRQKAKKAA